MVHIDSPWSYHGPFAIQWIWPLVLVPIFIFAPDSPWDFVRHNRLNDARRALTKLHSATPEEIESMLALIIHTNNQEQELKPSKSTYKQCFSGIDARRTEVACMSFVSQVTMGVCILGSSSYFFEQVGLNTKDVYDLNLGANALGVTSLILFWIFLVPNFGRRTIYLGAGCCIFVILMIVGILQVHSTNSSVGMAQACLFLIFTFVFQGTIAPLGWALPAELGSTRLRQKTIVLARNAYYISNTVGGVLNSYMLNPTAWNLKGYMTFVWAGTCFLTLIWGYFRLPESKDRSYEELYLLFAKKIPARHFSKYQVDAFNTSEEEKGGVVVGNIEQVA
jgi:SP family general alpha glucoside:H+ symporter-like MFS transporter